MITYDRKKEILNYLSEKHFATVKELAKVVFTSESSIRRDVKELEKKGYVYQIYGGVVLEEYKNSVIPITLRDSSNSAAKEKIAKEAAKYVFDGATILMDGSSTVRRIIKYINQVKGVKIITNNQRIFEECNNPEIQLYCTGGLFLNQSNVFVGSSAENYISKINADILFFSSQALSDEGEISDVSEEETSLRSVMLSRTRKKIFLCDSSKLGMKKTFTLCSKDDVDVIICDKAL